jgi:putative ubiquitin-RnfH superfamily antitoxin RatB of RatAB toxin-antitoxin module
MPSLRVELVYALPDRQTVLVCDVAEGTTVRQSVVASGILQAHPEIDLDRVEIYRQLIADPKTARRKRARESKSRRGRRE